MVRPGSTAELRRAGGVTVDGSVLGGEDGARRVAPSSEGWRVSLGTGWAAGGPP